MPDDWNPHNYPRKCQYCRWYKRNKQPVPCGMDMYSSTRGEACKYFCVITLHPDIAFKHLPGYDEYGTN